MESEWTGMRHMMRRRSLGGCDNMNTWRVTAMHVFFCKERKTTGIQSRPRTGTPSKKRKKEEPACDGERIDLGKRRGGQYCRAC
jgi:hypothetical protein